MFSLLITSNTADIPLQQLAKFVSLSSELPVLGPFSSCLSGPNDVMMKGETGSELSFFFKHSVYEFKCMQ